MFTKIDFKGLRQSGKFGYAADVPFFKKLRTLEFKPGLNILYGPNGSGKSTVLRILGDTMCATQGGVSAITEAAIRETIDLGPSQAKAKDRIGLAVAHDGQPVLFCDPRQTAGLAGGGFDNDFFAQGVTEVTTRRRLSHGQATASRLDAVIAVLDGRAKMPDTPRSSMSKKGVNDLWGHAIELLAKRMAGSEPKGQITVLLDEPEANFSLTWQGRLWELLAQPEVAERLQIIVASHSPFALGLAHANYIDFLSGYRQDLQQRLTKHFTSLPV